MPVGRFASPSGYPNADRFGSPPLLARFLRLRRPEWLLWSLAVAGTVSEGTMSFLDHLDELRKRLMIALGALLCGVLVALAFQAYIHEFMMSPLEATLPAGARFVFTEPSEGFIVRLQMAGVTGVFLAAPAVLWQLWQFVAPGLYAREKKLAIPFVLCCSLGFLAGGLFSHFVAFRLAFAFFGSFATETVEFMPRLAPTFSLYLRMLLIFGVVFQMPTLAFFLARVRVLTSRWLIHNFKYAVLAVFIIAAILTPSTDPMNLMVMAGPMLLLYGVSILIVWLFGQKD